MIREHDIYFKKVYGSNLSIGILVEIQAQSKQSKNSDFWTKIDHKVQFQGWALARDSGYRDLFFRPKLAVDESQNLSEFML